MSTKVETAFVPNYKHPPEVLPIYGCSSHCELYPQICWRDKFAARSACKKCRAGTPHVHWDRLNKIVRMRQPRVFSGHMGEIADLDPISILGSDEQAGIQQIMERNPRHLFHVFSHQKDFFRRYPKWSSNVWCCQSITSGEIGFPAQLECGKRVAYAEPVMGQLTVRGDSDIRLLADVCGEMPIGPRRIARAGIHKAFSNKHGALSVIAESGELLGIKPGEYTSLVPPDWLVIGLLNHADYVRWEKGVKIPYYEHIAMCIRQLMADARALGVPIFCKNVNDPRWAQMGIEPTQEWPK